MLYLSELVTIVPKAVRWFTTFGADFANTTKGKGGERIVLVQLLYKLAIWRASGLGMRLGAWGALRSTLEGCGVCCSFFWAFFQGLRDLGDKYRNWSLSTRIKAHRIRHQRYTSIAAQAVHVATRTNLTR
jgi:hypothetical protein